MFLKIWENFFTTNKFLTIFLNEITTILTPSTSEGEGKGGHVLYFGGAWLQIRNINSVVLKGYTTYTPYTLRKFQDNLACT